MGSEVPLARVIQVEQETGVPRQVLRPDMFKRPSGGQVAA
jgi:hypothetical protein